MFLVVVPNESTTPCARIIKILYAVNGYDLGPLLLWPPDFVDVELEYDLPDLLHVG